IRSDKAFLRNITKFIVEGSTLLILAIQCSFATLASFLSLACIQSLIRIQIVIDRLSNRCAIIHINLTPINQTIVLINGFADPHLIHHLLDGSDLIEDLLRTDSILWVGNGILP